jgi:alkanesulfonate monooxygenase SsuD/methylene tetrahydromethanopterin reductase-like flavin-dependent oxidoreductase (luciferase family)
LAALLFLAMKIGVQLPEIEYEASWKQVAEMARLAESVGLDSLWLGDHLLYDLPGGRKGPWEAWSMLAALAAVTERVELGPLVAALPFHNPAVLAKKAATVDEISGGRLILGVGAGWNPVEFKAFGLPYDRRISRFAEAFTIVRTLLTEGRSDFRGEWYSDYDNDPARLAPLISKIDAACVDAGRLPEDIAKTVAIYIGFTDTPSRRTGGRPLVGTVDEIADKLRDVAAAGVSHVQAVLDPIVPESIEKLGEISARLRDGS